MAIHTDFWVTVGTAAPVIALSAIVLYGNESNTEKEFLRLRHSKDDQAYDRTENKFIACQSLTIIVVLEQVILFLASLQALATANTGDLQWWMVMLVEFASVVALLAATVLLSQLKSFVSRAASRQISTVKRAFRPSAYRQKNVRTVQSWERSKSTARGKKRIRNPYR